MWRKKRVAESVTVLMFGIVCRGCFLIPEEGKKLLPPLVEAPVVQYDVEEVIPRVAFVKQVSIAGRLVPAVKHELFFRSQGGRLVKLFIQWEDFILKKGRVPVEENQILAELDTGNLDNQIEQREINLEKARNTYEKLRKSGANEYDVRNAYLDVRLAELQLEDLQERLDGLRLVAPIDGVVTYIGPREGDQVQTYKPIIVVVDPERLVLECTGEKVNYFHTGMEVDVRIGSRDYEGTVVMTPDDAPSGAAGLDQQRMMVDVIGLPSDVPLNELGIVELTLEKSENAVVVRKDYVHQYSGRSYVNVLVDGLKEEREVELGIQTTTEVEIVAGLQEGDLLITR